MHEIKCEQGYNITISPFMFDVIDNLDSSIKSRFECSATVLAQVKDIESEGFILDSFGNGFGCEFSKT